MFFMVSSYLRKVGLAHTLEGYAGFYISMVGWDRHHITRAQGVIFFQLLWVGGLKEECLKIHSGNDMHGRCLAHTLER